MSKSPQVSTEHLEHLTTLSRAKTFLGREFLTWLWYVAETSSAKHQVTGRSGKTLEFDLWVDDRLVLESQTAMSHENVMKGGVPSQSHEAAAALKGGKTVKEMKVGVNVTEVGEFTAILNCDELTPRSLKLPVAEAAEVVGFDDEVKANQKKANQDAGEKNADDLPLAMRIKQTEVFLTILDGLFARFLKTRVNDTWEQEDLAQIRAWIKKRQDEKDADTLH